MDDYKIIIEHEQTTVMVHITLQTSIGGKN